MPKSMYNRGMVSNCKIKFETQADGEKSKSFHKGNISSFANDCFTLSFRDGNEHKNLSITNDSMTIKSTGETSYTLKLNLKKSTTNSVNAYGIIFDAKVTTSSLTVSPLCEDNLLKQLAIETSYTMEIDGYKSPHEVKIDVRTI